MSDSRAQSLPWPALTFFWTFSICIALMGFIDMTRVREPSTMPDGKSASAIPAEFYDLAERDYPVVFAANFGVADSESFAEATDLGRAVYVREGCYQCHTQFVRRIEGDVIRWGKPSEGWETLMPWGDPRLVGNHRVGPDLSHEAGLRSNDWHAAHLYAPRSIVADSIMPPMRWLFTMAEGRRVPNREGLALIAYLQSLGSEQGERTP